MTLLLNPQQISAVKPYLTEKEMGSFARRWEKFQSMVSKPWFSFLFFFAFLRLFCGIWKFPGQGSNQSCSFWPIMPQPQQLR